MHVANNAPRSKLPVKPYKGAQGPSVGAIAFHYAGSQRPGLRIRDMLSAGGARLMAQPNDVAIRSHSCMKLYLSWPGYSSASMLATIECAQISMANLAILASRHIASFVEKCSALPVSTSGVQWRVGPGAITMNNVVLTALYNTGGDIWQAELEIEG
ncbi:hypothetical protein M0805_007995 [Coniferiporia weirii]|nr:hypothetical protein M0805_007995 [Coniferiporia weirii]